MNDNGFRSPVSNSKLVTALVAGVVATHVATITGYWYGIIGFPNLDWPRFNGMLLFPEGPDLVQFVSGLVFHSFTSMSLTLIFVFLIHPRLPWKNTMRGNLIKALVFAEFLGLFSALIFVPRLFPQFNPGFLSLGLSPSPQVTIGIFLWHAIWGVHLGALYNPTSDST